MTKTEYRNSFFYVRAEQTDDIYFDIHNEMDLTSLH